MIFTSRVFNFITLGSFNETLCSRLFRKWSHGSSSAGFMIGLIDVVFYRISGEKDHVYQSYLEGKK